MSNIKILENKILTNNGEEFGFLRFIPIKQENIVLENEEQFDEDDLNTIIKIMKRNQCFGLKVRIYKTDF